MSMAWRQLGRVGSGSQSFSGSWRACSPNRLMSAEGTKNIHMDMQIYSHIYLYNYILIVTYTHLCIQHVKRPGAQVRRMSICNIPFNPKALCRLCATGVAQLTGA